MKLNYKAKLFWLIYILLISSVILICYYLDSKNTTNAVLTDIRHKRDVDLTQLFVPHGKQYSPQDGKIYECITRDIISRVDAIHDTRDFRLNAWSHLGEEEDDRVKSFQTIFDKQIWIRNRNKKTPGLDHSSTEYIASGGGSTLEASKRALALLHCLVDRLKAVLRKSFITLVDIPCGDFYWMRHFVGNRTDIKYTGVDIVPTLITRHKINFRNMTHAQFKNLDIVTAGLNKSYDVIFCREMLQHLTTNDVMTVLKHFSDSGSKLLVTTNSLGIENKELDINKKGRCRNLNLMLPPISLVPPVCSVKERNKSKKDITNILRGKEVDLTQNFVPQGKRYNPKEGVVYECISRKSFSNVEAVHKTRNFRSDGWRHSGESQDDRIKSFQEVFDKRTWLGNRTAVLDMFSAEYRVSGPGSSLKNTKRPIAMLHCLIDRLKAVLGKSFITLVDIPCGDFYWMRHFVGNRTDIEYTGVDIVPTLITRHKINFRNMTHAQFKNLDIVTAGLNKSYDVIFCREMLQHLTTADVMAVLEHFSESGSKLLVTTNILTSRNVELNLNGARFRKLNLLLPPINLVPPVCIVKEATRKQELSVWTLPLQQRV